MFTYLSYHFLKNCSDSSSSVSISHPADPAVAASVSSDLATTWMGQPTTVRAAESTEHLAWRSRANGDEEEVLERSAYLLNASRTFFAIKLCCQLVIFSISLENII